MPGMKTLPPQLVEQRRGRQVQAMSSLSDRTQFASSNTQSEYSSEHAHEADHSEPNQFVIFMVLNVVVFTFGLILYYTLFSSPR